MLRFHVFYMNSIVFFILSTSFTASVQQRQSNIRLGSSLSPTGNPSWSSPSGLYAFGFYQLSKGGHGVGVFLDGVLEKTVVWTARRDDPPVSGNVTLLFNLEGMMVLQSTQGRDTVIVNVSLSASSASMLDSGNFVLYSSDGKIIWESFENPTDTILPTQSLPAGTELFPWISENDHSTGRFRLKMQRDGNLVQYPSGINVPETSQYAYWASDTYEKGDNVSLNLDVDGHLFLLNATGFNIRNLTEGGKLKERMLYLMRIDWDGIFRLYSHNLTGNNTNSIVWSSTNDRCDPIGLCGLNSYCVLNDQKPDCVCLPGFAPVIQGNWTSGCERYFTAGNCSNKAIQELENTVWEDISYSVLSETTKENCEQACLADCNCDAALFKDGECKMQRLPLRFGRRRFSDSYTAFIKVDAESSPEKTKPEEGKKEFRKDIIILSSVFVAVIILISATLGTLIHRYRVRSYKIVPRNGGIGYCEDISPLRFSYSELEKMTDGFKEELGRGPSCTIYKGTVSDGKFVAVKRLERVLPESEREFHTEMKVSSWTHHRNLVRLLGYLFEESIKVLVYEYMSNGSLADLLFTPEKKPNWIERMGIARDIARGILYLHDECETQIIHCDIKPENIHMDDNRCAKVSDFGLAKVIKPDQNKSFPGILRTGRYVAPEWQRNLPITVKADVYSFGVVFLEIICLRRCLDQTLPEKQVILEVWVYNCLETGQLSQLVEDESVDRKQLERMIKVALWCIQDEPCLRPSMKKILLMLEGTVEIPIPPDPLSFVSCI